MRKIKRFAIALCLVSLGCSGVAYAGTEICMALDGSGSVSGADFAIELEGTAASVEDSSIVPQDGSVTISIVQFSTSAQVEVPATVIDSQGTADIVAAAIRAISQMGSLTDIAAAITMCETQFIYGSGDEQVIDVVTDGISNVANMIAAADAAVTAGVDAINALGVGPGVNVSALEQMVRPQPASTLASGERGFVEIVASFADYGPAIAAKIRAELVDDGPVTVPTLPEWAIILLTLMLIGVGAFRSRSARVS